MARSSEKILDSGDRSFAEEIFSTLPKANERLRTLRKKGYDVNSASRHKDYNGNIYWHILIRPRQNNPAKSIPLNKWISASKVKITKSGVEVLTNKKQSNGFFSSIKKRASRSHKKGYMVLDGDGYPVHTGRNLNKHEALEIAKEARQNGEKGIKLKYIGY